MIKKNKCVVVGDAGVGKTSLIITNATNAFPPQKRLRKNHNDKRVVIKYEKEVRLKIFDTSGGFEYDDTRHLIYEYTNVFLLVFSIDSPESLEHISSKWYPEVSYYSKNSSFVYYVLLGTKTDLRDDPEIDQSGLVSYEQGAAKAEEIGATKYCECSALTQKGIKEVIDEVVSCSFLVKSDGRRGRTCMVM